jgi:PAS domain S-box-containing protein
MLCALSKSSTWHEIDLLKRPGRKEGSNPVKQIEVFGQYALHLQPLKLMEGRRTLNLSQKKLEVLALIVKARGKTVPKEAFLEKVWQESFVEEGNLTQTIFMLRKTLGKLPDGGEFIETIPRKGYRLAAHAVGKPFKRSEITGERRSASTQMSEEEQFRLLVDSIADYAIYMLDYAGRVATWNAGAENNTGFLREEVVGQHFSMFFVPEDIESRVPDREISIAARRGRCVGEGWRIRKNGERFWASYVMTAMRTPEGKLIGFAKVVRDLTEPKRQADALLRMEAVLRRERDRLHAAAESSLDALYICEAVRDENGEIEDFAYTYLNSNVEKMVSIPREILLRGKMCELLPVNRTQGFFDAYKKVVETGEPFTREFPVHARDVTSEWLHVRAVRFEDGIAITASDITERKRAEQRAAELTDRAHQESFR